MTRRPGETPIDSEKRKLGSPLTYPGVVLVFAIAVIVVTTTFVLPRFKHVFASLHARLPLPTRILLSITNFFTHDWSVLVAALAVVVLLVALGVTSARGRNVRDRLLSLFARAVIVFVGLFVGFVAMALVSAMYA
jgi:type II secretory pathway component PulF